MTKTRRKLPQKLPPAKSSAKDSLSSSKAKTPANLSTEYAGGAGAEGVAIVGENRVLDSSNAASSPDPSGKKPKAFDNKMPKPQPTKNLTISSPVAGASKWSKPPPAHPPRIKGRPFGQPAPAPTITSKPGNVAGRTPAECMPAGPGTKRTNRVDEGLNAVTGVVDNKEEEDRLVMRGDDEVTVVKENVYPKSMLLGGGPLHAKMQAMARH